jgi:two-component system chemotaxis response regulator CheB
MSDRPVRVLVAEDSLSIRKYLVDVLSEDPSFEVVGEAQDGRSAIELCTSLRPDVVTMDMMMPVMTGLAATEYIMAYCPTPILIVSASTNRGEIFRTYDALAAGAVDVLEKPLGTESDREWDHRFVAAVRVTSRIRVITHLRARLGAMGRARPTTDPSPVAEVSPRAARQPRVLAIGASTGGPAALLTILRALPEAVRLPVLVVLHIAEPFGRAMAEWLDAQTGIPVRYPREGERLPAPGWRGVLMAPPDSHLTVEGDRLVLGRGPERHSCRPSVDVLFESLARSMGAETVACLLTGMGKDGALGLLAIRQAGGLTIAQDEATSVIFGMPGEAVKLGAAASVLPLEGIAPALARAAGRMGGQA